MSIAHWLVLLSIPVNIAGSFAYIRDTLRGTTKPNRVTWLLWMIAPLIGASAAISANADIWATFRILLASFIPLVVFTVSFINPESYWKLTTFDLLCAGCSVLALIAWGTVDSPRLAILLAATGDAFAALPTIRKAWAHPESETGITYLATTTASLLVIPSIRRWDIENSAFQIYLIALNSIILFAIYRKRFWFR